MLAVSPRLALGRMMVSRFLIWARVFQSLQSVRQAHTYKSAHSQHSYDRRQQHATSAQITSTATNKANLVVAAGKEPGVEPHQCIQCGHERRVAKGIDLPVRLQVKDCCVCEWGGSSLWWACAICMASRRCDVVVVIKARRGWARGHVR